MDQAYQVKLDVFEGPLDLLLHLINQYEIDIYDIPMSQITDQYMHYIHTMQRLDLNIASEYLVMAATLVAIKSQMLLPKQKLTDESEEFIEDPREELMNRLIEYRKYKEAADQLKKIELNANQLFTRPPFSSEKLKLDNHPVVQGNVSVYEMLSALGKMMERKKWSEPLDTKIKRAEISIEYKMEEVLQLVKDSQKGMSFDQLFTYKSRSHIVVTFMALLELMKTNEIYCKQLQHLDVLYVFYREE